MLKEIYIFDIDGCVLSQVFPNIYDNNTASEEFIKEALKKSEDIILFEEFVKFYQENCITAYQVFFITGRQKCYFGEVTEKQLSSLKNMRNFEIIYYPEDKSHTIENYFIWKVERVEEIFKKYSIAFKNNGDSRNELIFKIFDDMTEYFNDINKLAQNLELKIFLKPIKNPEDWNVKTK